MKFPLFHRNTSTIHLKYEPKSNPQSKNHRTTISTPSSSKKAQTRTDTELEGFVHEGRPPQATARLRHTGPGRFMARSDPGVLRFSPGLTFVLRHALIAAVYSDNVNRSAPAVFSFAFFIFVYVCVCGGFYYIFHFSLFRRVTALFRASNSRAVILSIILRVGSCFYNNFDP